MQKKFASTLAAILMVFGAGACSELSNRDDFANALKNKTEAEVTRYAGKPVAVDSKDPNHVVWIYKGRTFEMPSRKTDTETDVIFSLAADGKLHVAEVVFK